MDSEGAPKGRLGFSEEFRRFSEEGSFSDSFFKKLRGLVKNRVTKRRWHPRQLEFSSEGWDDDKDTLDELAREFLTKHLAAQGGSRLTYVLDRAMENDVDFLMVTIFDQFLAERAKAMSPHRWNLRSRIKTMMAKLVREGKAEAVPGHSDSWAPPGVSWAEPLDLGDLIEQVKELPAFPRKRYGGVKRVSPEISNKHLHLALSAIFDVIRGVVSLDSLTEFFCLRLDVQDPVFTSVKDTRWELQRRSSNESDPHTLVEVKQALERMTPRQRDIFYLYHLKGSGVPEICAEMRLGKSVVYDELKEIERLLRE